MSDLHIQLDNPAWYALTGIHSEFSLGNDVVKRYQPYIAPFVAFKPGHEDQFEQLDRWLNQDEIFYFIGDLSSIPHPWALGKELDCVQMVCDSFIPDEPLEVPIIRLTAADAKDIYDLIQLVQPGYYNEGTRLMGQYYGIQIDHQLVAVAGERLRFEGYTEVSGICTHPEFTGRHYAHYLTAHVTNLNLAKGNIVFLHALRSNTRAIKLYDHLGFQLRRNLSIWQLKKPIRNSG